jgi:hypothetical protein
MQPLLPHSFARFAAAEDSNPPMQIRPVAPVKERTQMELLLGREMLAIVKPRQDLQQIRPSPPTISDFTQATLPDGTLGDHATKDVIGHHAVTAIFYELQVPLHAVHTSRSCSELQADYEQLRFWLEPCEPQASYYSPTGCKDLGIGNGVAASI